MAKQINIREELNKRDMNSCTTDFVNMYECANLSVDKKKSLVKLLSENVSNKRLSKFFEDIDYSNDDYLFKPYWYFTRHGVGPGSIPNYINVWGVVDADNGSYFASDKVIQTKDLEFYDLKEKTPNADDIDEKVRINIQNWLENPIEEKLSKKENLKENFDILPIEEAECVCGNTADDDGFYPCDVEGNEMEPNIDSDWNGHYVCAKCGKVFIGEEPIYEESLKEDTREHYIVEIQPDTEQETFNDYAGALDYYNVMVSDYKKESRNNDVSVALHKVVGDKIVDTLEYWKKDETLKEEYVEDDFKYQTTYKNPKINYIAPTRLGMMSGDRFVPEIEIIDELSEKLGLTEDDYIDFNALESELTVCSDTKEVSEKEIDKAFSEIIQYYDLEESLKEEYGYYKNEPYCEEIADDLENGIWVGETNNGTSWELTINGYSSDEFSPSFADYLAEEVAYPVRDGHLAYIGIELILYKSSMESIFGYDDLNRLIPELVLLGISRKEIDRWLKDLDPDAELITSYNFDIAFDTDEWEEKEREEDRFDESLKESHTNTNKGPLKPATFVIEDGQPFDGYDEEYYWNGWECPWFTKEVGDTILDYYKDYMHYNAEKDAFAYVSPNDDGEIEYFVGQDVKTVDGVKHLYPIGNKSWIWDKYAESEDLEEDYTHFTYKSGANPYITKTDKEAQRILNKYKGKVKEIKKGFYEIDDTKEDSFITESAGNLLTNQEFVDEYKKQGFEGAEIILDWDKKQHTFEEWEELLLNTYLDLEQDLLAQGDYETVKHNRDTYINKIIGD